MGVSHSLQYLNELQVLKVEDGNILERCKKRAEFPAIVSPCPTMKFSLAGRIFVHFTRLKLVNFLRLRLFTGKTR